MVAKVTPPGKKSFFLENGVDIHTVPSYEGLPQQDKNVLALMSVEGACGGFAIIEGKNNCTVVTRLREPPFPTLPGVGAKWDMKEKIPALILPASTRIEPCTDQQMEDELRAQQKPSFREK